MFLSQKNCNQIHTRTFSQHFRRFIVMNQCLMLLVGLECAQNMIQSVSFLSNGIVTERRRTFCTSPQWECLLTKLSAPRVCVCIHNGPPADEGFNFSVVVRYCIMVDQRTKGGRNTRLHREPTMSSFVIHSQEQKTRFHYII